MRRWLYKLATAVSLVLFVIVLAGVTCHALFRPHQRFLLQWKTPSHEYGVGFKALGVQLSRSERWPAGGPPRAGGGRSKVIGSGPLLMYQSADLPDTRGATVHSVVFLSIALPLVLPALWLVLWLVRHRRHRRRGTAGQCPAC